MIKRTKYLTTATAICILLASPVVSGSLVTEGLADPELISPTPERTPYMHRCDRRNAHTLWSQKCGEQEPKKRRVTPRPEPEPCQWEIRGTRVTGRCELNPWITAWQEVQG